MKKEDQVGVDMVLKDGNLITNVFNRLIRTCFYSIQNNCNGKIPKGNVSEQIKLMTEKTVFDYERYMYNHEFHRISYVLDDFIRGINKHWVNNVKIADAANDAESRKQLIIDCFYACKVMAILIHPIAPKGCEMFREYLNLGEELWDWSNIFEPLSFYIADMESHALKYLEPRVDFFKKHDRQLAEM